MIYITYLPYWSIWTLLELAKFTACQQTLYYIIDDRYDVIMKIFRWQVTDFIVLYQRAKFHAQSIYLSGFIKISFS